MRSVKGMSVGGSDPARCRCRAWGGDTLRSVICRRRGPLIIGRADPIRCCCEPLLSNPWSEIRELGRPEETCQHPSRSATPASRRRVLLRCWPVCEAKVRFLGAAKRWRSVLARQVIPCDGTSEIVRCFVRLGTTSRAWFFSTTAGDVRTGSGDCSGAAFVSNDLAGYPSEEGQELQWHRCRSEACRIYRGDLVQGVTLWSVSRDSRLAVGRVCPLGVPLHLAKEGHPAERLSPELPIGGREGWAGFTDLRYCISVALHCMTWRLLACSREDTVETTKRGRWCAVGRRGAGLRDHPGASQTRTMICCVACHVVAEMGILEAEPPTANLARGFQRLDTESHASTRRWLGRRRKAVRRMPEMRAQKSLLL